MSFIGANSSEWGSFRHHIRESWIVQRWKQMMSRGNKRVSWSSKYTGNGWWWGFFELIFIQWNCWNAFRSGNDSFSGLITQVNRYHHFGFTYFNVFRCKSNSIFSISILCFPYGTFVKLYAPVESVVIVCPVDLIEIFAPATGRLPSSVTIPLTVAVWANVRKGKTGKRIKNNVFWSHNVQVLCFSTPNSGGQS